MLLLNISILRKEVAEEDCVMSTNLDEYRRHRKEKSRLMWLILSKTFDELHIPAGQRHRLMFMDEQTFTRWCNGDVVISKNVLTVAEKYLRLRKALIALYKSKDTASRWLLQENMGSLYKGEIPLQKIVEGGETVLDNTIDMLERVAHDEKNK